MFIIGVFQQSPSGKSEKPDIHTMSVLVVVKGKSFMMMKKLFVSFVIVFSLTNVFGEELKVGMKASDWQLEDLMGKKRTMDSWDGKVLLISYLDPDSSDVNEHLTDALIKAIQSRIIMIDKCVSMGILDCDSSWKPNSMIKLFVESKSKELKKSNSSILFDYDATIRKKWGFEKNSSNLIILDKNRICRAIVKGRVPEKQLTTLINLVSTLQHK